MDPDPHRGKVKKFSCYTPKKLKRNQNLQNKANPFIFRTVKNTNIEKNARQKFKIQNY